jgi:hypothetical protein
MPLSDHVQVSISLDSIGIARAGFGIPLILSASVSWTERVRFYSSVNDVGADFATTSPEYLAAQEMFSQDNQPESIAIGRSANKPTQQYTVGAQQVVNSTGYNVQVQSQAVPATLVTYTSSGSAQLPEIHNGLVTQLNTVASKNWTAVLAPLAIGLGGLVVTGTASTDELNHTAHGWLTGDGPIQFTNSGGAVPAGISLLTDYYVVKVDADNFKIATSLANALAGTIVDLTSNGTGTTTATPGVTAKSPSLPFLMNGNTSGSWFSVEIRDEQGNASATAVDWLSNAQTHSDPDVVTDLTNIALANNSWYALCTLFNSSAYVLAAAGWVESNTKIYAADICDSQTITGVVGAGGTADTLHSLARSRTSAWYHPSPASFLTAALYGKVLPLDPGSETWKFKPLSGVAPVRLTGTHRTNLKNKKANTYEGETPDVAFTWEGTAADGEFIDTIRGLDWWVDDLRDSLAEALLNNPKIPMTDPGIQILANEMIGSGERAVQHGIVTDGTLKAVVPKASSISSSDRRARKLSNMKIGGQLAGAVHDIAATIVVTQ